MTIRKRAMSIAVLVLVSAAIGIAVWKFYAREDINALYPQQRLVKYSFTARNPTNRLLAHSEFWTYAPVKRTATQYVLSIDASHPYRLAADDRGNQRLYFTVDELPPYGAKVITIKAVLALSDQPRGLTASDPQQFLKAERFVEADHPRIVDRAQKLGAKNPMDTTKNIYDWVVKYLRDGGYEQNDHGALYALKHKRGDCTEYMYLLTALNRASDIPARGVAGYVYSENAILRAHDYHNWAEVYLDGAWRMVDPQKKVFMDKPSNYIAMRIIADGADSPAEQSQRFFATHRDIEVAMN